MIKMEVNEQMDRLSSQRLGEEWIGAILEGALDRLEEFCDPSVTSFLLTPKRLVSLSNAADLLAKYHQWFDQSADFQLEASRVKTVGERLGIFYAFLLQEDGEWYRIEQQLYCTLNNGRVEVLHLLCSGFQPVRIRDQAEPQVSEKDPARVELLELYTRSSDSGSTCALLTPAIKAKLHAMHSSQVLEVRVDDPSAKGDIESWCRLSGNTLLRMIDEGGVLRFFVEKK